MRMPIVVAALVLTATASLAGEATAPFNGPVTDKSRICMMQDSIQPKAGLAHEYKGKTYWLCCAMCEQAFNADPDRYAHAKDPVNGAIVDKATAPVFALNGKAYFFSSEKTRAAFAREPARYLTPARPS